MMGGELAQPVNALTIPMHLSWNFAMIKPNLLSKSDKVSKINRVPYRIKKYNPSPIS
jgi:hypothetical protein